MGKREIYKRDDHRINFALDLLALGRSAEEIDYKLGLPFEEVKIKDEQSRVSHVLNTIPTVDATLYISGTNEDVEKSLQVTFKDETPPVSVHTAGAKKGINRSDFQAWLYRHRIVFLNSGNPAEYIKQSFQDQVYNIEISRMQRKKRKSE